MRRKKDDPGNTMSASTTNAAAPRPRTGRLWSLAPWLSRLVMLPPVLVFSRIGIRFLTNPGHAIPGVSLHTPEAFTDTRVIGARMVTLLTMLITFLVSEEGCGWGICNSPPSWE